MLFEPTFTNIYFNLKVLLLIESCQEVLSLVLRHFLLGFSSDGTAMSLHVSAANF